jgi:hypothetical protein
MQKDKTGRGIVLDERAQEQPKDSGPRPRTNPNPVTCRSSR